MKEIWKPVEGYEGFYEVSNTGRVRSLPRTITLKGKREGQIRTYEGKELKLLKSQNNLMIHLQNETGRVTVGVGLLVARHFIPGFKESGRKKIKFKDGNTFNCSVENLE